MERACFHVVLCTSDVFGALVGSWVYGCSKESADMHKREPKFAGKFMSSSFLCNFILEQPRLAIQARNFNNVWHPVDTTYLNRSVPVSI